MEEKVMEAVAETVETVDEAMPTSNVKVVAGTVLTCAVIGAAVYFGGKKISAKRAAKSQDAVDDTVSENDAEDTAAED